MSEQGRTLDRLPGTRKPVAAGPDRPKRPESGSLALPGARIAESQIAQRPHRPARSHDGPHPGTGAAAAGAAILTVTQASIAHANIALNTRWIGLLFTTNKYHICHHSVVLEESNTNYGCSAIIWDRVFKTFLDKTTGEAGTGATEPTMWGKFLMPFKEPEDTAIAPGSTR